MHPSLAQLEGRRCTSVLPLCECFGKDIRRRLARVLFAGACFVCGEKCPLWRSQVLDCRCALSADHYHPVFLLICSEACEATGLDHTSCTPSP